MSPNSVSPSSVSPEELSPKELSALVRRVFHPGPDDTGIAVLIDLPDARVPDTPTWRKRRQIARGWADQLSRSDLGLPVHLYGYRNPRMNNADLPEHAWPLDARPEDAQTAEQDADTLEIQGALTLEKIFKTHSILLAPTRFSATAPLKLAAPRHGFRAATMPGFNPDMTPALRLDYEEINRRCERLKVLLDEATGADFLFDVNGRETRLHLDLRFRQAHASGGLVRERGKTGNLPSGETYIVPYEGEREGKTSRSAGTLPVELSGEVVFYTIRENRAVEVEAGGPVARKEADLLGREPAYGNLAELGLGVLSDFGVRPVGEILLDEKLGLHIAFGRSDHFGGQVGAADFSHPDAVVHIDRVYLSETQPRIRVRRVDLRVDEEVRPLMREGQYVEDIL